jgi:hypothetical protein
MKNTFVAILLVFASPVIAQTKIITIDDVVNNVGNVVRVCEKVYGTQQPSAGDRSTYLNMGSTHGDSLLVLVISAEAKKRFDYRPDKDLLNRQICVTGRIELQDGKRVMVVNKQEDITIVKGQ